MDASAPKSKPMRNNHRKHPHQKDALPSHHSNEDKTGNANVTTTVKSIKTGDRMSHDHDQKRRKIIDPTTGPQTEGCDPKLKSLHLFLNYDRTGMTTRTAIADACPQRDPEWKQYMSQHSLDDIGLNQGYEMADGSASENKGLRSTLDSVKEDIDQTIGPPQESIDPKLMIATSKLSQFIRPDQQSAAPTKVSEKLTNHKSDIQT